MAARVASANPFRDTGLSNRAERRSTRPSNGFASSTTAASPGYLGETSLAMGAEAGRGAPAERPPRGSSSHALPEAPFETNTSEQPQDLSPPSYRAKPAPNERSAKTKQKSGRKVSHVDIIDQLDITTGFGAFHHDGPFDAASSHRNRAGARRPAPMGAFDPASLSPPLSRKKGTSNGGGSYESAGGPRSSPVSHHTDEGGAQSSSSGGETYANASSGLLGTEDDASPMLYPPPRGDRRGSDTSITLGYPVDDRRHDSKSKAVAEAFGFVDNEAWQDFGRSQYSRAPARSRETSLPPSDPKVSKSDRADRAASVWDMEATLRVGKPVAAAPPMPALPAQYADASAHSRSRSASQPLGLAGSTSSNTLSVSGSSASDPKRSKSLIQRIKKARNQGNIPLSAAAEDAELDEHSFASSSGSTAPHVRPNDRFGRSASGRSISKGGESVLGDVLGYDDDVDETHISRREDSVGQMQFFSNGLDSSTKGDGSLGRKTSLVQKMKGLRSR